MAYEVKMNLSASFEDVARNVTMSVAVVNQKITVTTTNRKPAKFVQTVGTSEEAMLLADLSGTTIRYAVLRNLDPTNYVQIRKATGEAAFARMKPDTAQDGTGGFCVIDWESGVTAPFLIANTAACDVEITLIPL